MIKEDMTKPLLVFEACGQYDRTIEVKKDFRKCFECRKEKDVLTFDSSDGEYTTMRFCIECLQKFSSGCVSESTYPSATWTKYPNED